MSLLSILRGTADSILGRQNGDGSGTKFGRRNFFCSEGTISAGLSDPYWCDTYNKGRGKELWWMIAFELFEDESQAENYSYRIEISGLDIDVSSWTELDGYSAKWSEAINPALNERYGMIYQNTYEILAGGEFVVSGEISLKRIHDTEFFVELSGRSESGVPFRISKSARFTSLKINSSEREDEAAVASRLARELDPSDLTLTDFGLKEHSYESGVRMAGAEFLPRPTSAQQDSDGQA